ncbi:MAG TPA: AI-2E family transporter [Pseudonocardia sp.]
MTSTQPRAEDWEREPAAVRGAERGRSAAISDGLAFMARWSLRLALIALGFAGLWWVTAQLWVIVLPVLLALLIATVLNPPTRWLRRRGAPPAVAAAVVLLGAFVLLGLLLFFLARSITSGFSEIANSAVAGLQRIQDWLSGPPLNIGDTQFDTLLQQVTQRLQSSVTTIAGSVISGVGTVASLVVTGLLALVLAFLFVKDGDKFLPWLRGVVGPRAGGHISVIFAQIWATLGSFIRGQVLVSLCDGIFIGIGLLIVGVPLALPLAVLTFIGGFIPIVGALFAGALSVLVALVSNGFTAALIVLGIVLLVQQLEGNVLQPILQGKSLGLHAAVVLLAVTAGSSIFGIAGAFLAVPVAAAVSVVLRYLFAQVDRTSSDDETDAPADPGAAAAAGVRPAPDAVRAAVAANRADGGGGAERTAADRAEADRTASDPGVARAAAVDAAADPLADPRADLSAAPEPPAPAGPGPRADGAAGDRPAGGSTSGAAAPGAAVEPRPDAPNPEQLEIADDAVPERHRR